MSDDSPLDGYAIPIPCPQCKEEFEESVARLKEDPELVRPACGARFGIEAEDFRRAFEKADEAIAELRRKLGLK